MFGTCCGCAAKNNKTDENDEDCVETIPIPEITSREITAAAAATVNVEKQTVISPVHEQPTITSVQDATNIGPIVTIEISNEDEDDEVFREGVGPPILLAENLATNHSPHSDHVPLPQWFDTEEDSNKEDELLEDKQDELLEEKQDELLDVEQGGSEEPPNTPIGKDELALRRHRFFSELMIAAQRSSEHKVTFNPLGPNIEGGEYECCQHHLINTASPILDAIVNRLETVTSRLEQLCHNPYTLHQQTNPQFPQNNHKNKIPPKFPQNITDIPPALPGIINNPPLDSPSLELSGASAVITMSVQDFSDILAGPLAQFLALSVQLGGDIADIGTLVSRAFNAQRAYLTLASTSARPHSVAALLQPTSDQIAAVQSYREGRRTSPHFNHLSAVSESIPALGWVAVTPAPAPYVKEMNDAGQFYTNRVLKEWKEKDKKHVEWVKAWIQIFTELQAFVKQHHTTGLVWAGKNVASAGGVPPPPPPGCPPPPPFVLDDLNINDDDSNNDRSALFAQINQGEDITKKLKKVTDDMQTHKNTALRTGPAPFKAPSSSSAPATAGKTIDKPPVFVREGKKWLIEYQKGNKNLVVDGAEMNNVVYLFKCTDSTVVVKGKLNSITLDSCKKTSVVFDSLVACVEFINCQSVQMQVLGKVPTISIDKTDGCQIYLCPDSLNVEIVSSKSSEMNVMVPNASGDYTEYPVPEQYKTTVIPGKGLNTIVVESKG